MRKRGVLLFGAIFVFVLLVHVRLANASPPQWSCSTCDVIGEVYGTEGDFPPSQYNVSQNVSDPDGDPLTFTIENITSTLYGSDKSSNFYYWISIGSSTGILEVNSSLDNETGQFNISVDAKQPDNVGAGARLFIFYINATNDFPVFTNIQGEYNLTQNEIFTDFINASDEEEHYPLYFSINFTSCELADWSTRTNCSLLNLIQMPNTSAMLNLTPSHNDVGVYYANISVMDFGENYTCVSGYCSPDYQQNKTTFYSTLVKFNVFASLEINASDCQNKFFQEGQEGTCWINLTTRGKDDTINASSLASLRNYNGNIFNSSWFFSTTLENATNFTLSFLVNVTPSKREVGNWSINFSVSDISSGEEKSEIIYVYVNRTSNDVPSMDPIANENVSTSQTKVINISVYDDDFLIPDKNESAGGFNETLVFNFSVLNRSDLSQELPLSNIELSVIAMPVSGTNLTRARLTLTPNASDVGEYTINVSVRDKDGASDWQMFNLTIFANSAPVWNESMGNVVVVLVYENNNTFLNFSANVTDPDGDVLTFRFVNDSRFDSFSDGFNGTTGEANFTPNDYDVGYHNITVYASDGFLETPKEFNITVLNVHDTPIIEDFPVAAFSSNYTGSTSAGINVSEDDVVTLTLWTQDDDIKIPSNQKDFYNESLRINLSIQGPNPNLFNFSRGNDFPDPTNAPNRTDFVAVFTPNKSDVGVYNITLQVLDNSNLSDTITFNLTVLETPHAPSITPIDDIVSSIIESIYVDFNSTDVEDVNETAPGSNLTYTIINLTAGGDFLTINSTTGVINFSFSQANAGVWNYTVRVNDSSGLTDEDNFTLYVYDYPKIIFPNSSFVFYLAENTSSVLNFSVNHSVQDNLNYTLYIRGQMRNSTTGYGNGTSFLWAFTPNFTDETTCTGAVNITLNVSNVKLSNSTTWQVVINHTNSPLNFKSSIPDQTGTSPITISLSSYFSDLDAQDGCNNQTIGFIATRLSGDNISASIVNWTYPTSPNATFSSASEGSANFSITAFEYTNSSYDSGIVSNATSNNFTVTITTSTSQTTTTSSGGGGGGGGGGTSRGESTINQTLLVSLKIITPGPVSSKKKDILVIPLKLENNGEVTLNNIILEASVAKDGKPRTDLVASFDKSSFDKLEPGETQDVTLVANVNTQEEGLFEVTITANVEDPAYMDWAKVFIEVKESLNVEEKILFTEQFIIGNPECAELKEAVDEAKQLLDSGDEHGALVKANAILDACKRAIAQPPKARTFEKPEVKIFRAVAIATALAIFLGVGYYYYRRIRLMRKLSKFGV